ncbi:aspartyl protease family protein [Dictyobacter formicarum]|uniref:PDZ domain-containing protein n=1 Tax=Dictyobacter formicarum TaxID=2778368 RepID=A0ABQ3VI24_9CHLR|nr:aspartyl protease family protein [Dictyobacter formicarum]GHO85344.1 hypothetical protein KSZ_33500 [Dictyobacter formicarum]
MTVQQHGCISLYLSHDRPYVELEVRTDRGYVRKARFLVDTGGGALILTEALVRDLELSFEDESVCWLGKHIFRHVRPPRLLVGSCELGLAQVSALMAVGTYSLFPGEELDGILPGFLLSRYCVLLDYSIGTFSLSSASAMSTRGEPVPISLHPHSCLPRVEVTIAGEQYGLLLDTGASCTMLSDAVIGRWIQQFPTWPRACCAVGTANMGVPGEEHATMMRIPRLTVGSVLLKNITVVSHPGSTFEGTCSDYMTAPIVGALAGNVLRQFRIEIDYVHAMSYWEWNDDAYPYDMDMVGLTLALNADSSYYVAAISDCNYACVRQSVRVGDRLLQVNGLKMTGLPLSMAVDALRGSPGQRHTLLLERDGELRSVSVATARIV